jgi:hypothetical protein
MSGVNIEASREAVSAWLTSFKTGKKGILHLSFDQKALIFTDLSEALESGVEKQLTGPSINQGAIDFLRDNFERLIPKDDIGTAHELRKVIKKLGEITPSSEMTMEKTAETAQEVVALAFRNELIRELGKFAGASPNAKRTIDGIVTIFINRKEISQIEDEAERNRYILHLTGLLAEISFCVGLTVEDRLKNLEQKMQLLQFSYARAKEKGTLEEFFSQAFRSGPCFNGRITTLAAYAAESEGLPKEEAIRGMSAEETKYAVKLGDEYYSYRELLEKTGEIPSKEGFLAYVRERYKLGEDSRLLNYCENPTWFDKVYPQAVMAYI